MAWTLRELTLAAVNGVLGRIEATCSNLRGDGSLADAALSPNIARYADLAPRTFAPVTSAAAGVFTIGTVTVARITMLSPGLMLIAVALNTCTLTLPSNSVSIGVPFGYRVLEAGWGAAMPFIDNGTPGTGRVRASKDSTTIEMRMDLLASTNWQASVANSYFAFEAIFPVYK